MIFSEFTSSKSFKKLIYYSEIQLVKNSKVSVPLHKTQQIYNGYSERKVILYYISKPKVAFINCGKTYIRFPLLTILNTKCYTTKQCWLLYAH